MNSDQVKASSLDRYIPLGVLNCWLIDCNPEVQDLLLLTEAQYSW